MNPRAPADRTRDALKLHRAGRLAEARALYEAILAQEPRDAPALNGLGTLLHAKGEFQRASELLGAAIVIRPGSAIYHNNLGNALRALGRRDEAVTAYRVAMRLDPGYALAAYNLGALQLERGDAAAARRAFDTALARKPALTVAVRALAGLLLRQGEPVRAEDCLRNALRTTPDHPELLSDLGVLLRGQGRIDDAIACHERLVAVQADRAGAYNDLGALYQLRGRVDAALACFGRALELDADSGPAHFNRAKLLTDLARHDDAVGAFEKAIALAPQLATEAACHLAVAHRHLCDWAGEVQRTAALVARIGELLRTQPDRGLPPLTLNVVSIPAALRLAVACHLGRGLERETDEVRRRCAFRHASRSSTRHLRIGYVSPDFRAHPVGTLIHDIFRHHDRDAVTVHAYSLVDVDDAWQRSVRAGVDVFVDVSRDAPEAIARRIHADGIDVLVDLAGYTTYSRTAMFALRPAPVQLHWMGYLDTMGADFLPYMLADEWVVPADAAGQYSETIVSLPMGFAVASGMPAGAPPVSEAPARAELGLPEDAFVFCCMNGLHKLDASTFDSWMRILGRVPGSVLWLQDTGSAQVRSNLAREAAARGVSPQRLHFAPRVSLADYLARYRRADLFLDTFAYNAGATAVGALQAGLPVLTRPGENFMSRMGASLCAAAGMPGMICKDAHAYEERAVALATQPAELAAVRQCLAAARQSAPLFNVRGFARQLESAYRAIWEHHHQGAGSKRIEVGNRG